MNDITPEQKQHAAKARYLIDSSIDIIRDIMVKYTGDPCIKENIDITLNILATDFEVLGEDFCIEKGQELKQLLDDYHKHELNEGEEC